MRKYRQGVIGVFVNEKSQIVLCERSDIHGVWQLPQGGIERGEGPREAFFREMQEELGTKEFRVLRHADKLTKYDFPKDRHGPIQKKYLGQQHYWFLAEFINGASPNLTLGDGEFINWNWFEPEDLLGLTIKWKQDAYRNGLKQFDLIPGI